MYKIYKWPNFDEKLNNSARKRNLLNLLMRKKLESFFFYKINSKNIIKKPSFWYFSLILLVKNCKFGNFSQKIKRNKICWFNDPESLNDSFSTKYIAKISSECHHSVSMSILMLKNYKCLNVDQKWSNSATKQNLPHL